MSPYLPIGEFVIADNGEAIAFDYKTRCLKGKDPMVATESVIMEQKIGAGEEIIITGLFQSHFGNERNISIVRIGNIAMLKDEPVWTRYPGGPIDAHLVEARSIGGLSGSPVFVNLPPIRIANNNFVPLKPGEPQVYLLHGLMHGHFDIQNLKDDAAVMDDAVGGINSGIEVVIPVEKIIETIEQADLLQPDETKRRVWESGLARRRIRRKCFCRHCLRSCCCSFCLSSCNSSRGILINRRANMNRSIGLWIGRLPARSLAASLASGLSRSRRPCLMIGEFLVRQPLPGDRRATFRNRSPSLCSRSLNRKACSSRYG